MKYKINLIHAGPSYLVSLDPSELNLFSKNLRCPACGEGQSWEEMVALGGGSVASSLKLVCCRECGHITYDKLPDESWLDAFYSTQWDQINQSNPQEAFQVKKIPPGSFKHFESLGLSSNARVLDYGCGFGNTLSLLQTLGYKNVYGVERSAHRARYSSTQAPSGHVLHGGLKEACELATVAGGFDVILLNHVTEHLLDPFGILSGLKDLLKPDGVFLLLVPDLFGESELHTTLFFPHLHLFNKRSFSRLLARLGFKASYWKDAHRELVIGAVREGSARSMPEGFQVPESSYHIGLDIIKNFLQAPWKSGGFNKRLFINFWHPAPSPSGPNQGFQLLRGVNYAGMWIVRRIIERMDIATRDKWLRRYVRIARRLYLKQKPLGNRFLAAEAVSESSIPWLVSAEDRIPLLLK